MLDLKNRSNSFNEVKSIESICLYRGEYNTETVEVSITIPTYKRSELLIETIKSCKPVYGNSKYEIIVVFNALGEANDLISFVKKYNINNIAIYENEHNIGMFQNWNMCIRNASGKWISIMHDDDMFEVHFFEYVEKILQNISSKTAYVNFAGKVIQQEHYDDLYEEKQTQLKFRTIKHKDVHILGVSPFYATTCGTLINRGVWISLGGIDVGTYPSGDVLMPLKMMNNGYECLICGAKMNYYRHLSNASQKKEVMDLFIHFYLELQSTIYDSLKGSRKALYLYLKKCLEFKAIDHVFVQAENHGVCLDSRRPDHRIQTTIRYKIMDLFQRAYWHFRGYSIQIDMGGTP